MARPQSQRKGGMRLPNPLMAQGEAPTVAARPIQRAVGEDRSVAEFISGIAAFGRVADTLVDRAERRDMVAGEAARKAGLTKNEQASAAWAEGYQRADAALSGDADGEEMLQGFLAGQDVGMDPEGYIQQVYKQKTKGLADGPFKAAYDAAFAAKADRFRALVAERRRDQVIAKAEDDAASLIDRTFFQYGQVPAPDELVPGENETDEEFAQRLMENASRKRVPDAQELNALFQHARSVGISGRRFNEMLLAAANSYGSRGTPEFYEALKQPRADGTPPLYSIPEFKRAIDEGELQAYRVKASHIKQKELLLKAAREEAKEARLKPIYIRALAQEDPNGARDALNELLIKEPGLFSLNDIHTHATRIQRQAALEETEASRKLWHDLYVGIYRGSTKLTTILEAELPGKMKAELMEKFEGYQSRLSSLDDKSRSAVDRYIRSAEPQAVLRAAEDLDFAYRDDFDFTAENRSRVRAARNQALAIVTEAMEEAALAAPDKRTAILERARKSAFDLFTRQTEGIRAEGAAAGTKPPRVTSQSRKDALARYKRGELTEGELDFEYEWFRRHPQHEKR